MAFSFTLMKVYQYTKDRNILSLGYYTDMEWLFGPTVLSSTRFEWFEIYQRYIVEILEGNFMGSSEEWIPGINIGAVVATKPSSLVPPDVVELVHQEEQKMKEGDIIFCGDVLVELGLRHTVSGPKDCLLDLERQSFESETILNNSLEIHVQFYFNLIGNDWSQPQAIAFVCACSFCYFTIMIIGFLLYLKKETPVVTYATKEFIVIMSLSALIGTTSGFFFIAPPGGFTCMAGYWFTYQAFAVTMGCTIIKNWHLWYLREKIKKLKVVVIPMHHLIGFLAISSSIMTVILVVWTALPSTRLVPKMTPDSSLKEDEVYWTCESSSWIFILIVNIYMIVLFVFALLFSWDTRQFISVFRESEKIALAVYLVFLMEIILLPLIYTFNVSSWKVKNSLLSLLGIWRNFIPFVVIMAPKLWLAYFKPEKNRPITGNPYRRKTGSSSPTPTGSTF
eukprot:TRINITY_DN13399_c0_g1_i17.p1 TRINITY_DN13399_c0_g1~~TRINITY_DN13399_c0_g1_i17.p1  ORF type:complete len:450 (+),score=80.43 TRINITY_DN13399_c0_g1_i17:832-2181(+)